MEINNSNNQPITVQNPKFKLKYLTSSKINRSNNILNSNSDDRYIRNGAQLASELSSQSRFKSDSNNLHESKLLEPIKNKLQRRLAESGLSKAKPCLERLSIYREAFDTLISNFKTYQPILIPIKNEYESLLHKYKDAASQLEPAKELLFTLTNGYERRIASHYNQENEEIVHLKEIIKQLKSEISRIKEEREENRIMQNNLKEKLKELSVELLHESDARKLAVMDLNQLRVEYKDLQNYMKDLDSKENGDMVTLKIALKQANEAHTIALNRICYLETEYNDVVPKKEFEGIQNYLNETKTQLGKLQEQFNQLDSELASKRAEISSLFSERNELSETLESLQRASTPRPEWPRVANLVPGGRKRWQKLTAGKSSKEKLVVFSSELAGGGPQTAPLQSQISGLGSEEIQIKIPKFLEGCLLMTPRIKPKRDLLLLLEDIWLGRQEQLAEYLKDLGTGKRPKLPRFNDYLGKYLKTAFGVENIRTEWSLSIYAAGGLMTECEDIVRFRRIIDNEVDEAYHWYLHSLTSRLFNQLRELANAIAITLTMSTEPEKPTQQAAQNTESQPECTGCRLTTYQLSLVLAKLLDCEPQNPFVIRLVQAALVSNHEEGEDEQPNAMAAIPMDDVVCLEDLFHQAPGEPLPHFAQALVSHLEQGRKALINHIIVEIQRQKSSDGASVMVTPNEVLEAMQIVRPELEAIITSSPSCFFLLDKCQDDDKGRQTPRGDEDDLAVCDLDETCATREEQALAWSRCAAANEERKNYLVSTVHWLFQKDESHGSENEKEMPLEVIERRLWGANIKPYNKLTAVN